VDKLATRQLFSFYCTLNTQYRIVSFSYNNETETH